MALKWENAIRDTFTVTGQSGDEFLVMCPWHDDTSQGHLYINGRKGLYLCMSCGAKGSLDSIDIRRAPTSTDDLRERIAAFRAPKQEESYYPEMWLRQYQIVPHDYWTEERELPQEVVEKFGLGYDPFSNRCTMPLRDMHGRVLGVTYRRLDDGKPKYLNPKGYPIGRHLYGAWLIENQKTVALMEGQVDAIRGWSARVPSMALMGARITRDQIKVLQRMNVRNVVLMLDNDSAGTKGTLSIYEDMRGSGIRVKSGWYRPYWNGVKDPDGLNHQRLRKMYHSAVPITEWAERIQSAA